MAEYIEKQAAIDALGKPPEVYSWEDALMREQWERDKAAIEAIPPADVRPVARGKWEWRHRHRGSFRRVTGEDDFGVRHTITVDERYQIDDPYCPVCGRLNESVFLNFCPNCGAGMINEKEDN